MGCEEGECSGLSNVVEEKVVVEVDMLGSDRAEAEGGIEDAGVASEQNEGVTVA